MPGLVTKISGVVAMTCTLVHARCSKDDRDKFPLMAKYMKETASDLFWKSYEAVTDDGYVLTLFRIEGTARGKPIRNQGRKGPLLLQHGYMTDSMTWFDRSDQSELAVGAQLFLEGYDVWFGNIRGSSYSRRHLQYDPDIDNDHFWDFSFKEFGLYDMPAMVKTIHSNSDTCRKVTYVGHSQGTIMAFYGFSHAREAEKYISQFVALAPCFIGNFSQYVPEFDEDTYRLLASALEIFGIESILGPECDNQMDILCVLLGEESEECKSIRALPVGPINGGPIDGSGEVGVKQSLHMGQNFLEDRFQEFANYYIFGSWFQRQELVPLEDISGVPIRYMYMGRDTVCSVEKSKGIASRIPTNDGEITLDRDHYISGANDGEFMLALRGLLENSGELMAKEVCSSDFHWPLC